MAIHLARISGITLLIVLGVFYPFLPGSYDALAITFSIMAQLIGLAGLLLVPVGIFWLVYEGRKHTRSECDAQQKDRTYLFALASMIVTSLIAVAITLVAFANTGVSFGLAICVFFVSIFLKLAPRVAQLRQATIGTFNPMPLYLTCIPVAVLLFQITLANPATEFSRNYAIAQSAELVTAIEEYQAAQGQYPSSLQALWNDYHPSVVGIEQFHYAPHGAAYNLFFEQPTFLFNNFGTREIVIFNTRDEHLMPSYDSWILLFAPEELEAHQGWFAVHETSTPHWKYFWFD